MVAYTGQSAFYCILPGSSSDRAISPLLGSIARPGARQPQIEVLAAAWGIPVQPIRIAPRPSPAVIRTLLGTIAALQADVVHSHGYKANILLGPLPRRRRGPMLATLHGWTGGRPFSAMWMYERIERWALPRIESLVVVTPGMLSSCGAQPG